jgi:hypothetical protein
LCGIRSGNTFQQNNQFFFYAERGQNQIYNSCTAFVLRAKKSGAICKVSISYKEPSTGRTLRTHTTVSSFE